MMITTHQRVPVLLLFSIILMDLLTGMEFDLFVPSFPELQQHFHLSAFAVEALLSVNFIGYCLSLFLVGSLSDRYGRKTILLWGLVVFILGSILCTAATVYPLLLIGRFLQGAGIAAPAILSFLIIADSYPMEQQQFLMAMLNTVMNIAVAVAPVCGSYISLYFTWRGNFYVLLFVGLLTWIMTVCFVPRFTIKPSPAQSTPSGYKQLFASQPLRLLLLHIILMIVPYWIFVGMSPLLYMQELGVSLVHFGYYQGIFALLFAAGSFLFGLMLKYCE